MPDPLRKKYEELTWEEIKKHYRDVFNSPSGRMVLEDLKRKCFYYSPCTPVNIGETRDFNDGMRATLLNIINTLEEDDAPASEEGSVHVGE